MNIYPTCPVELTETPGLTGNTAELSFLNLSERRVCAMELIACWQNAERTAVCPVRVNTLRASAHERFGVRLTCPALPSAERVEVMVARVAFDDSSADWRADTAPVIELTESGTVPPERTKGFWHCVCGRYNTESYRLCPRCGHDPRPVRPVPPAAHAAPQTGAKRRGLFHTLRVMLAGMHSVT